MNEKLLSEKRNEKVSKMESILNCAKEEERPVTEEETKEFEQLEKEVNEIDNTISLNEKFNKLGGMKKVDTNMENVISNDAKQALIEKERKQFENVIRGIVNADAQTDYTSSTEAGVMIPTTVWDRIIDQVIQICPIFERADRFRVKGKLVLPKYDKNNSSIVMSYADEGTDAEGGKVVISQIELDGFLARALAKVSNSLINNTNFDIVGFVEAKMAQAIALFIESELLKGTNNKVEGLSTIGEDMTINADASGITVDDLMDTQDAVIDNYQANSIWIMNRKTRNAIRKLKDREGQYLLNRDLTAKWGYTLLGKDVYCSDAMDEIGDGKTPVFYGDFSGLAVKISEEANMQVLRERYAVEHLTGILAFMEFDAKIADTQKISRLVTGTTISA